MSSDHDLPEHRRRWAERALPLIDLTSLGDDDDDETVRTLCRSAVTDFGPVAAVCVWPHLVGTAVGELAADPASASIPVAGVANFPAGDADPAGAVDDARTVADAGGREVDVVFPWRNLADGDEVAGVELVAAVRAALGDDLLLKVILETGELVHPDLIRRAAELSLEAGADFLKTSTGKTPVSATPEAAAIMMTSVVDRSTGPTGTRAGIKISGGLRTVDDAGVYLDLADRLLGADRVGPDELRLGASSLLADVVATLQQA